MGRQLQVAFGQEPQVIMTTSLLEGIDGVQKMSKSLGNYVGINESATEMFGKIMSISDDLMWRYYELLTDFNLDEVRKLHPKLAKLKLAFKIVSQFHSPLQARPVRAAGTQEHRGNQTLAAVRAGEPGVFGGMG